MDTTTAEQAANGNADLINTRELHMKRQNMFRAAAVSSLAFAGMALAAVSFDPDTGEGFVGKGDVQSAFGWNNAGLQANHLGLSFTYESGQAYEYVCEWTTGPDHNRTVHEVTRTVSSGLAGELQWDARKQNQVSGFFLRGYTEDASSETGTPPTVGSACPGSPGTGAVVTSVDAVGDGTTGLMVHHGDESRVLPWSP